MYVPCNRFMSTLEGNPHSYYTDYCLVGIFVLPGLSVFQEEPKKSGFLRIWNLPILKYWQIMQNWKIFMQVKLNIAMVWMVLLCNFRPKGMLLGNKYKALDALLNVYQLRREAYKHLLMRMFYASKCRYYFLWHGYIDIFFLNFSFKVSANFLSSHPSVWSCRDSSSTAFSHGLLQRQGAPHSLQLQGTNASEVPKWSHCTLCLKPDICALPL